MSKDTRPVSIIYKGLHQKISILRDEIRAVPAPTSEYLTGATEALMTCVYVEAEEAKKNELRRLKNFQPRQVYGFANAMIGRAKPNCCFVCGVGTRDLRNGADRKYPCLVATAPKEEAHDVAACFRPGAAWVQNLGDLWFVYVGACHVHLPKLRELIDATSYYELISKEQVRGVIEDG